MFVEFAVFLLEKTLKDKEWLVNKITEINEDSKTRLSSSVGTVISPGNLREKVFFKEIWNDIRNTTQILKNFEKSRESLIMHFNI